MPIGQRHLPTAVCNTILVVADMHDNLAAGQRICFEGFDKLVEQLTDGTISIDAISAETAISALKQLPTDTVRDATTSKRPTVAAAARRELEQRNTNTDTTDAASLQRTADAIAANHKSAAAFIRVLTRDSAPVTADAAAVITAGGGKRLSNDTIKALVAGLGKGLHITAAGANHLAQHGGSTARALMADTGILTPADMRHHVSSMTLRELVQHFGDDTDDAFLVELITSQAATPAVANMDDTQKLTNIPQRWLDVCDNEHSRHSLLTLCSPYGISGLVQSGHPAVQHTEQRAAWIDNMLSDPKQFWERHWERRWIDNIKISNVAQLDLVAEFIDRLDHIPASEMLQLPVWQHGVAHKVLAAGLDAEQARVAFALMNSDLNVNDAIDVAATMCNTQ